MQAQVTAPAASPNAEHPGCGGFLIPPASPHHNPLSQTCSSSAQPQHGPSGGGVNLRVIHTDGWEVQQPKTPPEHTHIQAKGSGGSSNPLLHPQDHTTALELWQSLGTRPQKAETCRADAVPSDAARSQPSLIKLSSFQQPAACPGKQWHKTNTLPATSGCKRLQAPEVKFPHWQQRC